MVHTTATTLWFGLVVASALVLCWTALRAREHWDDPGGEAYSGLALVVAIVSTYIALVVVLGFLVVDTSGSNAVVELGGVLDWPGNVFLALFPLLLAIFGAQRKGLRFFTPRRGVGVTAVLLLLLVLGQSVAWLRAAPPDLLPVALASGLANALYLVVAILLTVGPSALAVFGFAMVLSVAYDNEHVSHGRRVLFAVGAFFGWTIPLAPGLVGGPTDAVGILMPVGVASSIAATAFALAVTRYDVFEESVAASGIGRDEVVETMEDAVVVVNDESEVLDLNPVARRLFEVEMAEAAGRPVADVVGESLSGLRTSEVLALDTIVGVREFEPRASVVTGATGDVVGFSIVLRDVTERRTREERLQVLNRVLRHNVRNEVSVISGYAELLGDAGATVALDRAATEITDTAYELAEIGEKARTIERLMAEPPNGSEPTALADAVDRAVEPVADANPDCEIAVDVADDIEVAANVNVLVPVLENVVENAAEHNDRPEPHVEIRATEGVDPSTVTITVVDDGPGIPDDERAVLESGDVTPLEHGSGLGLWIAKWGVTRLGGELSFSATEPRGTIVTVRLPVEGPADGLVEGSLRTLAA